MGNPLASRPTGPKSGGTDLNTAVVSLLVAAVFVLLAILATSMLFMLAVLSRLDAWRAELRAELQGLGERPADDRPA